MKKLAAVLIFSALGLGCFHATRVEKGGSGGDEPSSSSEKKQPAESEGGAANKPHLARRPQAPGRPPLAAAPDGLFVPGAVDRIQKALADRGYLDRSEADEGRIDAVTSAAVRKFQSDEGMARTGVPDHETVRKLGLDPDELFRKSSTSEDKQKQ